MACGAWADSDSENDPGDPDSEEESGPAVTDLSVKQLLHNNARFLLFSGLDIWRNGGFAHGGLLWAPKGLGRDGPVLKLMFGTGAYRYLSGSLGNVEVVGGVLSGGILPGWRFVRGPVTLTAYLGFDIQHHRLVPDDPSARPRGTHAGVRTGMELWYSPTPATMIQADASVSSIDASYNARLATGLRASRWFYFGPEVQSFAAGQNYKQFRAGGHVTSLRFADREWSAGFGWTWDTDHRSGLYGRLGLASRW
jgi:hypothetical protein